MRKERERVGEEEGDGYRGGMGGRQGLAEGGRLRR